MVYQAPRQKCLQNGPKSRVFDLLKRHLPVAPLLIWQSLPNHPDSADWRLRNDNDQETL
jgi:hypothetical protein